MVVKKKLILTVAIFFYSNITLASDFLILISVDGLRPDIINKIGNSEMPGFYRFREQGVWTDNARTDFNYTNTIPNHSSMITGRGVAGLSGHGQISNDMPHPDMTLHNNTGSNIYINSVFDTVHDHGLSTSLYVGKDKFILFDQSYNSKTGSIDIIGKNDGRDKIDNYVFLNSGRTAELLIKRFISDMKIKPTIFSFIHIVDTDAVGHGGNWTSPAYENAVIRVDTYLQQIFSFIDSDNRFKNNTSIILVADHGGTGMRHGDTSNPLNYTIPFYVWGPGVAKGKDIYSLNKESRKDPVLAYPSYEDSFQPIRNGDAANLAMSLLGLPAISGSTINSNQDLRVQ